ncbi:MAG TPA: efflux RND transporter periplasmic adaptor subunit [Desulfosporosinus sp.]
MKKKKNLIFALIGILILAGVGVWSYFYLQSTTYFTTDNAKVTAELYNVVPLSSGRLVKINVAEGSLVSENEVLARLQNGSYLRSPINGQVVKLNIVLNQMVSPTVPAAVIADTKHIYVGANVEETDIIKIKVGQEVTVQLDAYPGRDFKAHVKEINKVTQTALSGNATSFSTSGTYTKVIQLIPVKIVIDDVVNLDGLIGTNSTVKIKLK